jgi:hypothetical protein
MNTAIIRIVENECHTENFSCNMNDLKAVQLDETGQAYIDMQ